MDSSRRTFTKQAIGSLAALGLSPLADLGRTGKSKRKILCIGGHPDDPESGCGGTLARLTSEGHEVVIIYLTRGEAGIPGRSAAEAAVVRTREAEAACRILGARPIFAGQVDGDTLVNNEWINRILEIVKKESPDTVFTHWPIDSHKDHQAASILTIQTWLRMGKSFSLYFFEVCAGSQTMGFHPTDYVDISSTRDVKKKAVYCHTSQNPDGIYAAPDCNHAMMESFRGIEMSTTAAEAFVRMNPAAMLDWK
jgi:LmbE family N-acetylglucosaminyl deacetylase